MNTDSCCKKATILTLLVPALCAAAATERAWFDRSIVGMEIGPNGAQFGYSDSNAVR